MDKQELKFLEREYEELYLGQRKNEQHLYYARVGSVAAIIFIGVSTIFDNEFYRFFGTFGMTMLNGVGGICIVFTIISFLPAYKRDNNFNWDIIERKRKELDKLRKKVKTK